MNYRNWIALAVTICLAAPAVAAGPAFDASTAGPVGMSAPAPERTFTCSGTPNIAYFSASPTVIAPNQTTTLSWGFVSNAERADVNPYLGGVGTPGSASLSLSQTTTFTLKAVCGRNVTTAQVTVFVQAPALAPIAPPQATILVPTNRLVALANQALTIEFQGIGMAGLRQVDLYADGVRLATQGAAGSPQRILGVFTWHPAPGSHHLWAVATDQWGRTGASQVETVDVAPPAPPQPFPISSLLGMWQGTAAQGLVRLDLQVTGNCSAGQCALGGSVDYVRGATVVRGQVQQASFDGLSVSFTVAANVPYRLTITFTGTLSPDGRTLVGTWSSSNGGRGQITLQRS